MPIRSQQRLHVVAYDFGIKRNILRLLSDSRLPHDRRAGADERRGSRWRCSPTACSFRTAPAIRSRATTPSRPRARSSRPACRCSASAWVTRFSGSRAARSTVKMKFGHHGANHPVQDLDSGRVFITSQNHGFAVDEATLPANVRATHRSLFDNSLQGLAYKDKPAFSFQGHPEASPGPHDLKPLFERFNHLMLRRLQSQLRAAEEAMRRRCGRLTTSDGPAFLRAPAPDPVRRACGTNATGPLPKTLHRITADSNAQTHRHREHPDHRRRARSSSARRASSIIPAPRPARRCGRRATASSS